MKQNLLEEKAQAVGQIPSGLFVVCSQVKERPQINAFLASWVQQVSFDPLLISLAIKPGRPCYEDIVTGNIFSLNIVGEKNNGFLKHFWNGYDPEKNLFSTIPHEIGVHGGVLIKEAQSSMECKFLEFSRPGDHQIIFAEVLSGRFSQNSLRPMVHIRKTGLEY